MSIKWICRLVLVFGVIDYSGTQGVADELFEQAVSLSRSLGLRGQHFGIGMQGRHFSFDRDVGIVAETTANQQVLHFRTVYLADERDDPSVLTLLQKRFSEKIEELQNKIGLTATQSEKLKLAASSDCHRLARARAQGEREINESLLLEPLTMNHVRERMMPFTGLFKADVVNLDTLFVKVMATTLTDEQKQKYAVEFKFSKAQLPKFSGK